MRHPLVSKKITALWVPMLLVSLVLPSQAKPQKPAQSPEATKQFQIQATQATKIPAGSVGNFVVMFANYASGPMTGLDVQEGKQVSIPVAGRVGNVEVPAGATLVGRFNRLNGSSGTFAFDTLVANGKVYKINAASAPVPGKLRQDLYDLQNRRDGRDFAKTGIKERREEQRGRAAREYSNAAGSMVGNFSPLAGSLIGGVGSMVGTSKETEAVETSTAKQEEILDRDIPSVLVAEISPLQNITVQFNDAVDLNTPVATLPQTPQGVPPQGVPPQGAPVAAPQTNFANPGTTVPPTPTVASPYGYPGYGGYAPAPYGSPYGYPAGPGGTLP
ncbi:MAG: hypothetical protein WCA07_16470 [Gloeobacterales cyanobacterium]